MVISDWHQDISENALYPEIIADLQKRLPNFDCIFLEHPKDFQSLINGFLNGNLTWKEYAQVAYQRIDIVLGLDSLRQKDPNISSKEEMIFYFENKSELAYFSKKQHFRIYAVDTNAKNSCSDDVEKRNEVMAKNILQHFSNGKCHQALLPVGNSHQSGDKSIEALTTASGITTVSYGYDPDKKIILK